jgi:hypothetical protein
MGGSPIAQINHLFAASTLSLAFASFADSRALTWGLRQALCLRLLRRLFVQSSSKSKSGITYLAVAPA